MLQDLRRRNKLERLYEKIFPAVSQIFWVHLQRRHPRKDCTRTKTFFVKRSSLSRRREINVPNGFIRLGGERANGACRQF